MLKASPCSLSSLLSVRPFGGADLLGRGSGNLFHAVARGVLRPARELFESSWGREPHTTGALEDDYAGKAADSEHGEKEDLGNGWTARPLEGRETCGVEAAAPSPRMARGQEQPGREHHEQHLDQSQRAALTRHSYRAPVGAADHLAFHGANIPDPGRAPTVRSSASTG